MTLPRHIPLVGIAEIEALLADFTQGNPLGRMTQHDGRPFFRKPLVGSQRADHASFARIAEVVPGHMVPAGLFGRVREPTDAQSLSVLSVVFPFDEQTVADNAAQTLWPATTWLLACDYGHRLNGFMVHAMYHIHDRLQERGIAAVYPAETEHYLGIIETDGPPGSNWSERHVAYACGLGSFGLSRGLITEGGIAHRTASLIVACHFDHYGSLAESPFSNCPYLAEGACGACMERCPAGAITPDGHDVELCRQRCYYEKKPVMVNGERRLVTGCGLCFAGVPCATSNPRSSGGVTG